MQAAFSGIVRGLRAFLPTVDVNQDFMEILEEWTSSVIACGSVLILKC